MSTPYSKTEAVYYKNIISQRTTKKDGTVVGDLTSPNAIMGIDRKTGSRNPNWKYDCAHKINATSAYNRLWYSYPGKKGSAPPEIYFAVRNNTTGWLYEYQGCIPPSLYPTELQSMSTTIVDDIANKKIKAKAQSDREDLAVLSNLLQDV